MKFQIITLLAMLALTACNEPAPVKNADAPPPPPPPVAINAQESKATKKVAVASLEGRSDSKMTGKVVFTEINGIVQMEARMDNLSNGKHAIHIHASGDCSAADGSSAGGHWNPTNEAHGKWGEGEFHRGDIGNFKVDKNGVGSTSIETHLWCIGCDDETKNIIGKSIIIHAGEDDCKSQPSGAAGARIACGTIEAEE